MVLSTKKQLIVPTLHCFYIKLKNGSINYPYGFDPKVYSNFKFGSLSSAKKFSGDITEFLLKNTCLKKNKPIIVVTPSYWKIQHATAQLGQYVVSNLRSKIKNECFFMHLWGKNFFFNYSKIKPSERRNATKKLIPYFISKKDILKLKKSQVILIDDVYISGSVIRANIELLNNIGVEDIMVVTIAKVSKNVINHSPFIEAILNNSSIKSTEDLVSLANTNDWKITTRALRSLIENKNLKDVQKGINSMSNKTKKAFLRGLNNDNYKQISNVKSDAERISKYLSS